MDIKKGPWTVKDSKIVYRNPWIIVKEDDVVRPDGVAGIFGVVEMKHGVSVLPIDDENNVYLTREYRYGVERETIEVLSGGIDEGENKLMAAKRELQEEAGLVAEEMVDLGVLDPFTSVVVSPNYMFLARNLEFTRNNLDGTEKIKIIKVSINEAVQMVMENKITHGASVVAILKTKNYLGL